LNPRAAAGSLAISSESRYSRAFRTIKCRSAWL
jgi:hypothetical protein